MIKIESVVLPSNEQIMFTIEGMRNPKNSWNKIDTENNTIGDNDIDLMSRLINAGPEHRKFMRTLPVNIRITAPLYWWKEWDTYKIGTIANSCSTMHKITAKEFTLDDFSHEHLSNKSLEILGSTVDLLNYYRNLYINGGEDYINDSDCEKYEPNDKYIWWQLIQLLPSSYNQTRNITLNYEVLRNMYHQRKNHKLDEWIYFCEYLETLPYFNLMIEN